MTKRVSLGFDLRLMAQVHGGTSIRADQCLVPELRNPISVDPEVWHRPRQLDSFTQDELSDLYNPLDLVSDPDMLARALAERGGMPNELLTVCFTASEAVRAHFQKRFGWGYFEKLPSEEDLFAAGWHLRGFDVVDLLRLVSGLKGCGYSEPSWSELRGYFGGELNDVGLFLDDREAFRFSEVQGLEIPEHAPFVVVGILSRD